LKLFLIITLAAIIFALGYGIYYLFNNLFIGLHEYFSSLYVKNKSIKKQNSLLKDRIQKDKQLGEFESKQREKEQQQSDFNIATAYDYRKAGKNKPKDDQNHSATALKKPIQMLDETDFISSLNKMEKEINSKHEELLYFIEGLKKPLREFDAKRNETKDIAEKRIDELNKALLNESRKMIVDVENKMSKELNDKTNYLITQIKHIKDKSIPEAEIKIRRLISEKAAQKKTEALDDSFNKILAELYRLVPRIFHIEQELKSVANFGDGRSQLPIQSDPALMSIRDHIKNLLDLIEQCGELITECKDLDLFTGRDLRQVDEAIGRIKARLETFSSILSQISIISDKIVSGTDSYIEKELKTYVKEQYVSLFLPLIYSNIEYKEESDIISKIGSDEALGTIARFTYYILPVAVRTILRAYGFRSIDPIAESEQGAVKPEYDKRKHVIVNRIYTQNSELENVINSVRRPGIEYNNEVLIEAQVDIYWVY